MKKNRNPLYVTTLIAGAFFMEMLDGTIIATALPQMARSFHVGPVSLNIGMTAYMLTRAVFIPISGWMTDRFGARSIFATAIGVFTLASVLCAISSTLVEFILMHILQGIGGAMMVPVGRLIVLRTTPKERAQIADSFPPLIRGRPRPSFKTEKVAGESKEVTKWVDKYLSVGEWVMDQSVAIASSSGWFERTR